MYSRAARDADGVPAFDGPDLARDVACHLYEDAKSVSSVRWRKDLVSGIRGSG